jgi:Ca2+-binding EF-hand superfamily protein
VSAPHRHVRSLRLATALGLALGVSAATAVLAQAKPPPYDPHQALHETDTNGDGFVDRGEFEARMVEVFFFADTDRDGFLSEEELAKGVVFPEDFRHADTNHDGRLSLYEFEAVRFHDFDRVDADKDGRLSEAEVVAVYERGGTR